MSLQAIIRLVIIGLVLLIVWVICGIFIGGTIHLAIGAILVLCFLLYVLKTFNIF
jgi:hypothetical protein